MLKKYKELEYQIKNIDLQYNIICHFTVWGYYKTKGLLQPQTVKWFFLINTIHRLGLQ